MEISNKCFCWLVLVTAVPLFCPLVMVTAQTPGSVRLVDGPNPYEGRPEYFSDGVWLSLCYSLVDSEVPQVICTQLGYPRLNAMRYYAGSYGQAPGETFRRRIYCTGTETSLSDCNINSNEGNCDPRNTLGVSCNTTTSEAKIRLRAGSTEYEGRLEVFRNGVWGTVCRERSSSYIDHAINAHVACRELFGTGYGGTVFLEHETPSRFGILQSGAILMRYVKCNGDEGSMLACSHSSSYYDCNHDKDFTVRCFPVPQDCGGYINAESGNVTSPGYPDGQTFDNDTDCVWKIVTSRNRKIRLSFADIQSHGTGTNNNIQVVNSNGWGYSRSSTGSPIPDFVSSSNTVFIRQKVTAGTMGIDFHASWITESCSRSYGGSSTGFASYYIQSIDYSSAYPPDLDCYDSVQFRNHFRVSIYFYSFHLDDDVNGVCQDYLEVFDGPTTSNSSLGRFCGSTTPQSFISTSNAVLLHFHSDGTVDQTSQGYYVGVTGQEPDPVTTNLTAETGTIASPGFPEPYSNETDHVWIITLPSYLSVTLTFQNFSTSSCGFETSLYIYDLPNPSYPYGSRLASPCGSGLPTPVLSNTNVMFLRLGSRPGSTGLFRAAWQAECRRRYTSSSLTITSPLYPDPYPVDLGCVYVIQRDTGYYINLTISSLNLDTSVSGECLDYIQIRDGSSEFAPVLTEPLCNASLPLVVTSSQNSLWIKFHSDGITSPSSSGFRSTYTSHIKECPTQMMTSSEGSFHSPAFPQQYPRYTYCVWTITVQQGYMVQLSFTDFAVGQWSNYVCSGAYLRLYDGDSVDVSNVMDTLCGNSVAPKITSTGPSLTIVLNSFGSSPSWSLGFNASYISVAGADLLQDELFSFGPDSGDEALNGSSDAAGHVYIDSGFPFGDDTANDIYIGANGVVSLGHVYTWPQLPDSRSVICVYCAYVDNSDPAGGIYYHLYEEGSTVNNASQKVRELTQDDTFTASVVLVVTWYQVKQGRYRAVDFRPDQDEGNATFQLALISDGMTSYALVYYMVDAMRWTYRGSWSYVIIGISNGDSDSLQGNLYSRTETAYRLDRVTGNTGRLGTWLYKVGEVLASPTLVCLNWLTRNSGLVFGDRAVLFSRLPQCPCSHRDVWRKTRYLWSWTRTDLETAVECYRMNLANSGRHFPFGKECCYYTDPSDPVRYQQLVMDPPHAGHALAYNPVYSSLRDQYLREDKEGHDACCHPNYVPLGCDAFYLLRPVGECRDNIPFRFAWLFGDPHMMTLDEREYTFNGWGEYTLIAINSAQLDFVLQGRTNLTTTDDGSVVNATVFIAFGAEEDGTRVFVGLDPNTQNSLIIFCAGTDYSLRFQQTSEDIRCVDSNITLTKDNNSLVVTFPSAISLSVSVGVRSLTIGVLLPEEFQNQTKGLLGNYNGVKGDDFVLPNGTVLADTLTDRQIHEQFGNAWAVTEQDTVLRYGPREGPADFAHPEFTPIFLDELSAADTQAGLELCGEDDRACLYDFQVTGSQTFALMTRQARQAALRDNVDVKNTLPMMEIPANVTLTSNVPGNVTVSATDPDDGDTVTYRLLHDGNGALRINPNTGEITATINAQRPVEIWVYAVDSHNGQSPVRPIPAIVCTGCGGHGTCDYTSLQPNSPNTYVQFPVCECATGWTGVNCTEDDDACLSSPCHPLQTCTDLTPLQQDAQSVGYTCSACPPGYASPDGQTNQCLDVDECADEALNDCQMNCSNTAGSYQCSCLPGYRLHPLSRTCSDVNECAEKSDNCQHLCNNTEGGYSCLCREGYALAADGAMCEQSAASQAVCEDSSCSQGCRAVLDPATNDLSPQCFCLSGYELDPSDNATCNDHNECQDAGLCAQVCNNTMGSFTCSCFSGFQLNTDQRTCSPCPDLTYGVECRERCTCNGRGVSCHSVRGCVCESGWTGLQCQQDVDECQERLDACGGGQVCSNTNGSYICTCHDGYTLNDNSVCQDVDECSSDTACDDTEQCINTQGSFTCTCLPGYLRNNSICTDVDECATSTASCQQLCHNVPGSYNCDCYYGYRLAADRTTCVELSDPCAEVENLACDHGCSLDSADRAACFCNAGYSLASDQQSCVDIDECSANICSHTCNNTEGGFLCSCPPGMMTANDGTTCVACLPGTYGANCSSNCACGVGASHCDAVKGCVCLLGWSGGKCESDVNECDANSTRQECESKGATCVNLPGDYRCQCGQGFRESVDGVCEDVDECKSSPCSQRCENSAGSYQCLCNSGFSLNAITGDCTDVDECASSSTHSCAQRCHNTPGWYRCSCSVPGYVLSNDGVSCRATTSCQRTDCDFTNGGCFIDNEDVESCFCNNGYELGSDDVTCVFQQVDWCAEGVCSDQCQLSDGGSTFVCSCSDGYLLNDDMRTCRACPQGTYGTTCQSDCNCDTATTTSCNPVDGTCICEAGWEGVTCGDDVNECLLSPCGGHATCSNSAGSYLCTCDTGYVKNTDGVCTECPDNTFGDGCSQTCQCPGQNVQSCDPVDGTCRCKSGWEGRNCEDDTDECANEDLHDCAVATHTVCRNSPGAFSCVCQTGFSRDHQGSCVAVTRLAFSVIIDVTLPTADIVLEPSRSSIIRQVRDIVNSMLAPVMDGLVSLDVVSLRAGSVVADMEAIVPNDVTVTSSAASLSVGVLAMAGRDVIVAGQIGSVGVVVGNLTVSGDTTACELFRRYVTCENQQQCRLLNGTPACRDTESSDDDDEEDEEQEKKKDMMWKLVIGLAVGVPVVVAIVCIACAVIHRRAQRSKSPSGPDRSRMDGRNVKGDPSASEGPGSGKQNHGFSAF